MSTKLVNKLDLRKRPNRIRYYYLAATTTSIRVGTSYASLATIINTESVKLISFSDLTTKQCIVVEENYNNFLRRWRANYNNANWDYAKDLELGIPVPTIEY